jgi:RNA polymerase sigma-70 factor (ECF subfamily)
MTARSFTTEASIRNALELGDLDAAITLIDKQYGAELLAKLTKDLRSKVDAEDVYSEVKIAIVRGLPSFRGDSSVRTWCYSIVANAYRAHFSAQRPSRRNRVPFSDAEVQQTPAQDSDMTDHIDFSRLAQKFLEWRARLEDKLRRLIDKRLEGVPYLAIARETKPHGQADLRELAREADRLRKLYQRLIDQFQAEAGVTSGG